MLQFENYWTYFDEIWYLSETAKAVTVLHAFFDLGTIWRWVVSFTPWPLYPQGKSPWYPLDKRLGGSQNRSGRGGEKNSQPLPGLEPPDPLV
jgi:hypothetical protein